MIKNKFFLGLVFGFLLFAAPTAIHADEIANEPTEDLMSEREDSNTLNDADESAEDGFTADKNYEDPVYTSQPNISTEDVSIKQDVSDNNEDLYSEECFSEPSVQAAVSEEQPDVLDVLNSLSLDGDIGVNYYLKLSDSLADMEGARVEFTVDNSKTTELIRNASKKTINDAVYHRFTARVTSGQMTAPITTKVLLPDNSSIFENTYTVKKYCDYVLSDNSMDPELKTLVKSLLNYGGCAQEFFETHLDSVANKDFTEEEKDVSYVTAEMLSPYKPVVTGNADGLKLAGCTLKLDSLTTLRFYFKVDERLSIDEFVFKQDGKVLTPVKKGELYFVAVENIASTDLDKSYLITVDNYSIKYSPLSYVYTVLNSGKYNDELESLVQSLYEYNQASNQYFKSIDERLTDFLYGYHEYSILDVSKYDLTYMQVWDKICQICQDETFNIFTILVNGGRYNTPDEKAKTVLMELASGNEEQFKLLNAVNQKINEIVAEIDPKWSDFEKALYVHDWICLTSNYDECADNAHELAGVLLENKGVCQSFTYTFDTIMCRLGIETKKVYGKGHMWSEVCLDGEWYHMDITNDNLFELGGVRHTTTFASQQRLAKVTATDINKCSFGYLGPISNDTAFNTRYEEFDDKVGLFQKNMWVLETGSFQYYDGCWYNAGRKYGKWDPRVKQMVISDEVWVYKFNKETKAFESVDVGLPVGEWKDTYRGLYIVGDTAVTRTDSDLIAINLKSGGAETLLHIDGTIRDFYTDYTGIIKYRIKGDDNIYQLSLNNIK